MSKETKEKKPAKIDNQTVKKEDELRLGSEQASLALVNLLSSGMTMKAAKEKLGVK